MNNKVEISVLMSIYNEKLSFIKKAISSIINQTFQNIELIIVVDNPNIDESILDYLNTLRKKENVTIIMNEENIGLALSMNKALEHAKGIYIARMDADDISLENRLEEQLKFIKDYNYDLVACHSYLIDEDDNIFGKIDNIPNNQKFIEKSFIYQNLIIHPTVMIKKSVLNNLNGYRNFSSCQDYDLWLRMLSFNYKIGILPKKLFKFRKRSNSVTSTKHFIQVMNEEYARILYRQRKFKLNDNYSQDSINLFLENNGCFNDTILKYEKNKYDRYKSGIKQLKCKKILKGIFNIISSLNSRCVRISLRNSIKVNIIKKLYLILK